jgi:hypothetical protein
MNSFYIILFLSLIPLLYFAFNTKELPFFLPNFNTDNEKLLTAASKIKIFDWPSKVHTIENLGDQARSHSREYYTIVCAIFLKIFRKAKNDHITALVGLFANFVSTLLIYIIFSNYFNQNIGFLASLIYLTSFWSFHIILFIGHVILSQMFFLLCILTIQVAEDQSFNIQLILYFIAGSLTFISFHSSSAAHKYPPLAIIAFLFAIRNDFSLMIKLFEQDTFLIVVTLFFSLSIIYSFIHRKDNLYFKKLVIYLIVFNLLFFVLISIISISIVGLLKISLFLFGFILIFFHITLPLKSFARNVNRLIVWRSNNVFVNHYIPFSKLPIEDQKKLFGKTLPSFFVGGDLFWNLKAYYIFMPFIFPVYIISVILFLFISVYDFVFLDSFELFINFLFLFFISILPTLVHELTRGLKVAKAYYSILLCFIFFIFGFLFNLELSSLFDSQKYNQILYNLLYLICFIQFIHSFKILKENLESRTYVKNLHNFLTKNNIWEFNTYENKYNDNFVKNMLSAFPDKFKINIINNINDLKNKTNKILIVPPITSKVFFFNTQHSALIDGHFNKDPDLVKMIETKEIEKFALKKFKTMSSYPYYIYDDEVLSYMSIYLKKINDEDRYKGLGWVLDMNSK